MPWYPRFPRHEGVCDPVRWLEKLLHRTTPEPADRSEADGVALAEVQAARIEAERKLAATEGFGYEVRRVVQTARILRQQNNFSARIEQADGRWL